MVPWLAAGMISGTAMDNAPSITSTIRWEVSTLPPATAAGKTASSRLPFFVKTLTGLKHPAFTGESFPEIRQSTYKTAERVME